MKKTLITMLAALLLFVHTPLVNGGNQTAPSGDGISPCCDTELPF